MIPLKAGQIWLDWGQGYRWYISEVVSMTAKEATVMMRFECVVNGRDASSHHNCRLYWRHDAWRQRDHAADHHALATLLWEPT